MNMVISHKAVMAVILLLPITQGFAAPIIFDLSSSNHKVGLTAPNQIDEKLSYKNIKTSSSLNQLEEAIDVQAKNNGISSNLIKAVIDVESNFSNVVISPKGAIGLMQVMPETAARYGSYDLHDRIDNITVGTKHLAYLLKRYQNISYALAAYNAGEGNVDKYKGIPPFSETQSYVLKVLKSYNHRLDQALLSTKSAKRLVDTKLTPLKTKVTDDESSNDKKAHGKVILLSL